MEIMVERIYFLESPLCFLTMNNWPRLCFGGGNTYKNWTNLRETGPFQKTPTTPVLGRKRGDGFLDHDFLRGLMGAGARGEFFRLFFRARDRIQSFILILLLLSLL